MRMLSSRLIGLLVACCLALAVAPAQAQQNVAYGQWSNVGLPRASTRPFAMPRDPDLQFIIRDGVRGQQFATSCESYGGGQTVRHPTQLPVGNGWSLACSIPPSFTYLERMFQGQDGSFYCWLGVATAYRTVADSRLQAWTTPGASAQAWWWLQASSPQAWYVQPISFSGGFVWPLWLEVSYQTINFAPARNASCAGVLR